MLTIRLRLLLAFAALLFLLCVNQAIYYWVAEQQAAAMQSVQVGAERQLLGDRVLLELADTRRLVDLTAQSIDGHAPLPSGVVESYQERARVTRQVLHDLLSRMASSEPALVARIEALSHQLFDDWSLMLRAAGRDQIASITAQVASEGRVRELMEVQLPALFEASRARSQTAQQRALKISQTSQQLVWLAFGISVLLGLGVALVVSQQFVDGLQALKTGARRVGEGDFRYRIALRGDDELTSLGRHFNEMAEHLEAMTEDLRHANSTLESRAQEIARQHDAIEESARELVLFYRLIDQTEDALLIVDMRSGKLLEVNSAACDSLGYLKQELVGDAFCDNPSFFFANQSWDRLAEAVRVRNGIHLDWRLRRKDGSEFPAEIRAREVMIGNQGYLVAVARDVTRSKQMESSLRKQSHVDALTGIANRRAFDERLKLEWQRAHRHAHSLALLLIDVDHYKAYNDELGHPAGDRCLRDLATAMNAVMRAQPDCLCRYGGEEFAVLLAESGPLQAEAVAQRLHKSIKELAIRHPQSPNGAFLTISVGIACMRPKDEQRHELLVERADQALYQAKADGRNRSVQFALREPDPELDDGNHHGSERSSA